jgi:hypothetical protein
MEPIKYDLDIWQGQTFERSLVWKDETNTPVDLTGFTARMHIRVAVRAPTTLIELTTENDRITFGSLPGQINLLIPADVSTPIVVSDGVYDLELVSPTNIVRRLMEGKVSFHPEVTR